MMALRCGAEVNSMVTLFNGSVLAEGQIYRRHARKGGRTRLFAANAL
jgi:hypothetical protein